MIGYRIKQSLKRRLSSPLVWPAVSRRFGTGAVVLAYHRVGPPDAPFRKVTTDHFRAQMAWLRRHCHVLHPSELRAAAAHQGPRCAVLVTFDDGYQDYFEHAVPVLREFDVPAINFVATQFIDDGAPFWWDRLDLACQRATRPAVILPWNAAPLSTASPEQRMHIYRECQRHLKLVPDAEKTALLPRVFEALGVADGALVLPRQVMTWDQMRACCDVTTYGGHLHSHPLVSRIEPSQLEYELHTSDRRMAEQLGSAPTVFAYPDGDITDDAKTAVRRHGYAMAFGILEGVVTNQSDWFALPRLTGPATVADLAWRLARLHRRHRTAALPL
jgi:peptidoglycan/xylan/chitin deacetylase (PgdA/CDA1 family)